MIYLHGLLVSLILIQFFIRFKDGVHMLQQSYYMDERYVSWMEAHPQKTKVKTLSIHTMLYCFLSLVLILIPTTNNQFLFEVALVLFAVSCLGLDYIHRNTKKETKKPLKVTHRVTRLFVTASLLLVIIFTVSMILSRQMFFFVSVALVLLSHVYRVVRLVNLINQPLENFIKARFINQARQRIRSSQTLEVIGVTGSYGKTSTKHALHAVLSEEFNTLMTPESYNTPMGITLTVQNFLKPIHSKFIAEMGAYKKGEIQELCDITFPKYGVLTSVGPQHLETFKAIETIQATKFELIESLPADGMGFINLDDENIRAYYEQQPNIQAKVYTYGMTSEGLDFKATILETSEKGTRFEVSFKGEVQDIFQTKLLGTHNIYNLLVSLALGYELGISIQKMKSAITKMKPIPHRLELRQHQGYTIIDDAFNSNPVGSKMALEVLGQMKGKRIILTPGMVDLGEEQATLNKAFGTYMKGQCDEVILVGPDQTQPIVDGLKEVGFAMEHIHVVANLSEGFEKMNQCLEAGAFVLIENDLPDLLTEA